MRPLNPSDSFEELTSLLHRAYRELAERGLNITAADQSVETTRWRVSEGQCFVAEAEGQLVGTVTLGTRFMDGPAFYHEKGVAVLGQFAVDPKFRGLGLGEALMRTVERTAQVSGYSVLALDTPQPADHLIEYYQKRGFKAVGTHQWSGKTYLSVLLAKQLGDNELKEC
jgi:predicted N-acetyltransferase YhbS